MADLQSKRWIVVKGVMFMGIIALSAGMILGEAPSWRVLILLAILIWASARAYYFLFYVLERYVDPNLRYSGLWDMVKQIWLKRREG